MALPWTIAATLPCALLVYGFTDSSPNALQRHGGSLSTHLTREALCPGFEGNSDFYGLGIRIGVYLQWFSAWISNTVNPAGAAVNHDANTIFLTAITVATSVALAGGALQQAEAYLMPLLSNGFLFTVLSFLGLRLYLLQPSTAAVLRRNLSTAWNDFATSRSDESGEENQASWLSRLYMLYSGSKFRKLNIALGFRPVSKFKHPALSWAGVGARSTIGLFIAVLSVITWWNPSYYTDGTESCSPVLFFFGQRGLSMPLLRFFRVAAITLLVPIAYTFLYSGTFALMFFVLGKNWLTRHVAVKAFEFVRPGAWDRMSKGQKQSLGVLLGVTPPGQLYANPLLTLLVRRALLHTSNVPSVNPIFPPVQEAAAAAAAAAAPEQVPTSVSWDIKASELPPLSVLLHAIMSLWARGVEAGTQIRDDPVKPNVESRILCYFTHVYQLVVTICFILFIEETIRVAGITNVHTISSTGQLIPFIVGIASLAMSIREMIMLSLKQKYPEWKRYHFVCDLGMGDQVNIVDENGAVVWRLSNSPVQGTDGVASPVPFDHASS